MLDTALCECASGLRRVRCCALDEAALPNQQGVVLLDDQAATATKFFNEKKYAEAEALALTLLDLAPNHRQALRVLFEIRKAQKRNPAAEALGARLAALPGAPAARAAANLAFAQYIIGLGRYAAARESAERALKASPKDATAHHVLGVVLTETGHLQEGETHYRRAVALLGREDGVVLSNLAWNLKLQSRLEEAAALYEKALALRPDNKRGIGGYAQVQAARFEPAHATKLLDDALVKWPDDRALRLLRVRLDLLADNPEAALARLGDENLLALELWARGQALAQQKRLPEAVSCYASAKKLLRERENAIYQPAPFIARAQEYKAYFTADRIMPLPRDETPPRRQPVFLLGFPRSGSSLLEQLLSQLPGFAAGDDFAPVADLANLIPRLTGDKSAYPEALDSALIGAGADLPAQLRARYDLPRTRLGLTPDTRFLTDRAPSNLWHLGLIKLLFPQAPIIHVLRHPLDVMLSILSQDGRLEGDCGASIHTAARHYALCMDMVKHYRGQLTLRYLPVRYEDLITAPHATLTRVADFIGTSASLPGEAALRANAARPSGPVPVHFAARKPVHTNSLYAYREALKAVPSLFAEVQPVLAPWITELGYGDAP